MCIGDFLLMSASWYIDNGISVSESGGIDEVGRGPLAGPVVSAAVWICDNFATIVQENFPEFTIRDSKKMTHKRRLQVVNWINELPANIIRYSIASASVSEIDQLNILQAALLSMKRAYEALEFSAKYVLVDGNKSPNLSGCEVKTIIGGDDKVLSISVASVIAKEYRDALMIELSKEYPQYGWDTNVGYGSRKHMEAIEKFGISPHHRTSFAPVALALSRKI